jgi:TM2 domain-containing membrane protein YozV
MKGRAVMQSYQESQQQSQEQQGPSQSPPGQFGSGYQPPEGTYQPTQRAYQPPEGTYQPTQRAYQPPEGTYQPTQQPYQQPYPPQQMYPGYVGAYPMAGRKDWLTTLLLCIFVGYLGIHRFYTGHMLIGVIQLLTFGVCGIWTIVDLIMILTDNYRDANGFPLVKR